MVSRRRTWIAAGLLALLVGGILLWIHDVDLNLTDEGLYLAHAESFRHEVPDASNMPRLLQRRLGLVIHGWFSLTGGEPSVERSRLLWVILRVLTAIFAFLLARRLLSLPWAFVGGVLFALAAGPLHKAWFPSALVVMLWLGASERRRVLGLGLAGGALLLLFPVGIGGAVLLPVLVFRAVELIRGERARALAPLAWLGGATLLGALLFSTALAALLLGTRGGDPALWVDGPRAVLDLFAGEELGLWWRFARRWSQLGQLSLGALFQHPGDPALSSTPLGWIPGLFFLGQPLGLGLVAWRARREPDPAKRRLLYLLLVLATVMFFKTLARADLFHVTQASGPSYLLLLWLLTGLSAGAGAMGRPRGLGLWRALAPYPALLLFPIGYLTAVLVSSSQWAASPGSLSRAEQRLELPRARLRLPAGEARRIAMITRTVERHAPPGAAILTLPTCPAFYFLTARPCAVDDRFFPLGQLGVGAGVGLIREPAEEDQHLVERLRQQRNPPVILCPPIGPRFAVTERSLPRTVAHLRRFYRPAFDEAGYRVLVRKRGRHRSRRRR